VVAGATAYPRLIDFAAFREIADEVDAYLLVDAAHLVGLVAGGAVPSPVPHADVVSFSTHKVLRGPRGGLILCRAELAQRIDKAVLPFLQGGPLMHVIAAKAVALGEALRPAFRQYTRQVVANAAALAAELAAAGMRPVSGGTDTHLALLDLTELGVTGQQAERRAEAAGITVNKNVGPFDPRPPRLGPGVPVGTSAVTAQRMTGPEMAELAGLLGRAVRAPVPDPELAAAVTALARRFPAYPSRELARA